MFRFLSKSIVKWPVLVSVPIDGGKVEQWEIDNVEVDMIPQTEFNAIYDSGGGMDRGLIKRVVKGWPDTECQAPDKTPLKFGPEALEMICETSYVRASFVNAILRARNGQEAVRKN